MLESRLILSNNQSKATLWVLNTCLIVGLRPFIIILITASLSSKTYKKALEPECVPLDGTWSMLVRSGLVFVVEICFRMFGWVFADRFHRGSLASLVLLVWFGEEWITSIAKSQISRAGIPFHAWTCIERDYFSFRRTVWHWGLFLAHPTYWYNCSASENAQNSSWCWLGVFQVSCKIGVLK